MELPLATIIANFDMELFKQQATSLEVKKLAH